MNLVDEQHIVGLEIGEQRSEIARALQHRPRCLAQIDAQLVGDDVRQGRLAQPRRAEQQHVVERLSPLLRCLDENGKLTADLFLADVLVEGARPQRPLDDFLLRTHRCCDDQSIRLDHCKWLMPSPASSGHAGCRRRRRDLRAAP